MSAISPSAGGDASTDAAAPDVDTVTGDAAGDASDDTSADASGDGGDSRPRHDASALTFRDEDPTQGNVRGTLFIGKAADESDVTGYVLYWGSSATNKLGSIATVPKTGADVAFKLDAAVPASATHLLVFATNAAGESPTATAAVLVDNFTTFADVSAGQGDGSGNEPSLVVDEANHKLLIATTNSADLNKPGLFRCNLDGTGCTFIDISAGQGMNSGHEPQALIDTVNAKLLVVTDNISNGQRPSLFRCNLDGTACTHRDISAGAAVSSGFTPSALIDTANNKLLVVAGTPQTLLFRCSLDGLNCTHSDPPYGPNLGSAQWQRALIDTAHNALIAVTGNSDQSNRLFVYRYSLTDGAFMDHADISVGTTNRYNPTAVIDKANGYLLAIDSNRLLLSRCKLDELSGPDAGAGCTLVDMSGGETGPFGFASAVIDPFSGQLLVVTGTLTKRMTLIRCNIDATNCSRGDLSAGQTAFAGDMPAAVIDSPRGRLLVAAKMLSTADAGGGGIPGLYMLGLQ